jgi:exopolyphosphatase/pppGpp-phosphohydrolase
MRNLFLSLPILFILSACSSRDKSADCQQKWSVVEYGSSRVKLLVSEVNRCAHRVGRELYKVEWEVDTDQNLLKDKDGSVRLAPATADRTIEVSKNIMQVLAKFKVDKLYGISSGIYRLATNSPEVLSRYSKEIGTKVRLLSNEEEASTGLNSIVVKENPQGNFVVWDFGGNNMQFTIVEADRVVPVLGFPGSMPIKKSVTSLLKKKSSPNPITKKMQLKVEAYVLKSYFKKLGPELFPKGARVFGIGGVHTKSIGSNIITLLGLPIEKHTYTIDQVDSLAKRVVELKDSEMGGLYPDAQATNILTVHALMGHLGWSSVTFSDQTLALGYMDQELNKKIK